MHSSSPSDANTTVLPSHMGIDTSPAVGVTEGLHADPAHVGTTVCTGHVVASSALLEASPASGAGLDTILLSPASECLLSSSRVILEPGACQAFVGLDMTCRADADKT